MQSPAPEDVGAKNISPATEDVGAHDLAPVHSPVQSPVPVDLEAQDISHDAEDEEDKIEEMLEQQEELLEGMGIEAENDLEMMPSLDSSAHSLSDEEQQVLEQSVWPVYLKPFLILHTDFP